MSTTPHPVDLVLAAINPVPPAAVPARPDERARRDLAVILADPPAPHPATRPATRPTRPATRPTRPATRPTRPGQRGAGRWRPLRVGWPRLILLTGVVAVLALIAVLGVPLVTHRGGTAYAATPAPLAFRQSTGSQDPVVLLRQIAGRVQAMPEDIGSGRYAHLTSRSWSLFTRVDGEQVTSRVVPMENESWIAAEGSGRQVTRSQNEDGEATVVDSTMAAGAYAWMWPPRSLSGDDATLAEQLRLGHPERNGPAERLVAVRDAYSEHPLPPVTRAAMLRYLAATPGLRVSGEVIDRAGRHGIGFSLDSAYSGLPTRYTLIVDPDDGRVLDSEEMLTTTAGKLNVPVPSVIGYTVYLVAGYTDRPE